MFLKDRLALQTQRKYTDEGFLVAPARLARSGIYEYYAIEMGLKDREPNEVIRVYRPPEEVFKEESMNSFAGKPVTNDHPPELVDATNYRKYAVGEAGPEVKQDGDYLTATIFVKDAEAIKTIEDGKSELSNGYLSDIEWTEGIAENGEKYDAIQRNIRGNHIAIVKRGRAGPACKVADKSTLKESINMAVVNIDGVSYEASEQVQQAVQKTQAELSDAQKEANDYKQKLEDAEKKHQKEIEEAQAKLDAEKEKAPDAKQIDSMIKDRMSVVDSACKLVDGFKWEDKSNDEIIKAVVAEKCKNVDMESVSADYLKARFDMLVDEMENDSQRDLNDHFRKTVTTDRDNDEDKKRDNRTPSQKARDKMMEDSRNAWKKEGDK